MNLKPAQMRARLERPDDTTRLYLLHGPDESGATEMAALLQRALGDAAERVDMDGASLKGDPGRLADEAASMSLFGDRRFIRVTAMGEESLEAVTLLLNAERAGNPVVAIAPTIRKTGKLLKLVDAAPGAVACALYVPEGADATRLAGQIARDHGLRLAGGVADRLVATTGGDRAVMTREVEKIALYLDAAPERPADCGVEVLDAIGAVLDESAMGAAIETVVGGNPARAGAELASIAADNMAVPTLRQLAKRLIALADMRREVESGDSAAVVVKRHRVFWKEEQATMQALQRWNGAQLARAVDRVRAAERAMMAPGSPGAILAEVEGLAIARAAQRMG
ncbi:DNA polymerase III subunit delta [Sphingomonas sp.]|uniref:DNA polymerase III subunit delta n=1 Tax=Sphingomonas sp. TaxID=28214 RepID=UPI002C4E7A0A|nr:DNA polymerase III subunit delta [Sphingomonas sp.]HTG38222.1 DNA polymerase III subunit delta [Sphingomonas sp.]